jgi:hypothetical protein
MVSQRPGAAGGTESGSDPEHQGGRKRYQGKQNRGPGHESGYATGNKRGDRRVDTVHEPKAAADKVSCEDESGYSSGECYK